MLYYVEYQTQRKQTEPKCGCHRVKLLSLLKRIFCFKSIAANTCVVLGVRVGPLQTLLVVPVLTGNGA